MTPTEIARVAAGLTRAQREFAAGDHVLFARGYKPGEKLVELGILDRQLGTFGDRISRTELGMMVRDHILREKSGG